YHGSSPAPRPMDLTRYSFRANRSIVAARFGSAWEFQWPRRSGKRFSAGPSVAVWRCRLVRKRSL
ncbi:uncharacterized protein METZ01_LOCUS417524, partial [marine metagenome]